MFVNGAWTQSILIVVIKGVKPKRKLLRFWLANFIARHLTLWPTSIRLHSTLIPKKKMYHHWLSWKTKVKKRGKEGKKEKRGSEGKEKVPFIKCFIKFQNFFRDSWHFNSLCRYYIPDNDNRDHKILNYT